MTEASPSTPPDDSQQPVAVVITASDGVSHGAREDRSGDRLEARLVEAGHGPVARRVVPDERERVGAAIAAACDTGARLVVVTGGTGLGPRDVTPEAVGDVTDLEVPGFGEVMRAAGRATTSLADLSRSLAAARGSSLVVAVPGSPSGAIESLEAVLGLVPHALDLLAGDTSHTATDTNEAAGTPHDHDHDHEHSHDHDEPGGVDDQAHAASAVAAAATPAHGEPGHVHDEACAVAHGDAPREDEVGTLMAVFASPLAALLLAWGRELGYETVLVDPRVAERDDPTGPAGDGEPEPMPVATSPVAADARTDIVVTDHHRDELADVLDVALDTEARFIGLMGSARHAGPHVDPLRGRGRSDEEIDRIVRPIGFDIGSRTPAEIAVATLADLVARRTGRR